MAICLALFFGTWEVKIAQKGTGLPDAPNECNGDACTEQA